MPTLICYENRGASRKCSSNQLKTDLKKPALSFRVVDGKQFENQFSSNTNPKRAVRLSRIQIPPKKCEPEKFDALSE